MDACSALEMSSGPGGFAADQSDGLIYCLAEAANGFCRQITDVARAHGAWPRELHLYRPPTGFDKTVIRTSLQHICKRYGVVIDVYWIAEKTWSEDDG